MKRTVSRSLRSILGSLTPFSPAGLIAAGLILLAAVTWWYWNGEEAATAGAYSPSEIAYDRPLRGVHEMEPTSPNIPFLPVDGPQPQLALPQAFHDFGLVAPTDEPRYTFAIRNTGGASLTVARIFTTCDCTTADLTASVIPPGKVALLTVYFDPDLHDVRGDTVRRGVIIESNDRTRPQAEVWIQARVSD